MRAKLFGLAAILAAGFVCWSVNQALAQQAPRRNECIRERSAAIESIGRGDPRLQGVAESCRSVGASERGERAARAHFYSGRAYNLLGQAEEAASQLEIAVNLGRDFPRFEADLRRAKLELAQAYRELGRRESAQRLLTELGTADPAAAYQSAMFTLVELGPAGRQGAFDALKGFFVQDEAQLAGGGEYSLTYDEIRRGRAWVYWLGMDLGREAMRPVRDAAQRVSNAQRAIDYFTPAAQAIIAAGPSGIDAVELVGGVGGGAQPSVQDLAKAFFELGLANLRAAGVSDDVGLSEIGQAGQLDCLGGARAVGASTNVASAVNAFNAIRLRYPEDAGAQADAHWGLGCAILADIGNARDPTDQQRRLAAAVSALRQVPGARADALLTLARAQVMQGGGMQAARDTFQRALVTLPRSGDQRLRSFRSRLYVEMARTHYLRVDPNALVTNTSPSLFTRAVEEIRNADPASLNQATANLRTALEEDASNAEASLLLGHIALLRRQFREAENLLGRFRRAGNDSVGAGEGAYLLSRALTLAEQDRLEPEARRGGPRGGGDAVALATRAYNVDPTNQEFRRLACLVRIVYGYTGDGQYCTADRLRDRERFAEALLYEGVFYLRLGQQQQRRHERMQSWSRSIQRFEAGGAEVTPEAVIEPGQVNLQELLHYGERYVRRCTGLGFSDPERAPDDVRKFFRRSGMPDRCG
jgi:tetratricopeptide (TPR) repeat protein